MLDLKYRYLKPDMIPNDKYIKVKVVQDFGRQEFEKQEKFQILVLVLHQRPLEIHAFHGLQDQVFQLILSYKQRMHIAKIREKRHLEGIVFKVKSAPFYKNRKEVFRYFYFFDVEIPNKTTQILLDDVVCSKPLEAPNQ